MEPAVPSGHPLTEDTDILTVVDDFESIYDVPYVTVNRVGTELQAEVYLSGVKEIDEDRLTTAQSVAGNLGYKAYARVFGDWGQVLIYFTNDPSEGMIWALEGDLWSQ